MFKGTLVALVTPFKDGKIDERKLRDLVEWHIAEGTDGLVPVGTTGESTTLTHEEHARVIEIVVKSARKRIPVIAGTGSNATDTAIELTREARELGADAALLVNPYYNRPTQEGLYAHFSAVAEAVSIPIFLYNIPFRTGVNLLPDTIVDLARSHRTIIGVKESSGSMDQTSEILNKAPAGFVVLSGDDSLTLPLMSIGAQGIISVVANLVPKSVRELTQSWLSGDIIRARAMHLKLFPLVKSLFLESSPAPIKAAMHMAGLLDDESLRLPLVPIKPETRETLRKAMADFGVQSPVISR